MTARRIALAVLALATAAAAPVSAQDIKPGLYEVTSKIGGNNQVGAMMKQQQEAMAKMTPEQRQQMADMPRQLEKMMANMSPAQRKQMQDAMGQQAGAIDALKSMQMKHNADGSTTVKMCVTQAMIDQRHVTGQEGDCTQNNSKMSGGVMKISYTCTRPPSRGEGELRMTGPNSYSTRMRMTSLDPANKQAMEVESTSTWQGANCGNVKPIDASTFKRPAAGGK